MPELGNSHDILRCTRYCLVEEHRQAASTSCGGTRTGDSRTEMEGGDEISGSVWETDHQPPSLTSVRSDSGMNSMEYWDYTVELTELECIGQSTGMKTCPFPPPPVIQVIAKNFVPPENLCKLSNSAIRSTGLTIDPNFYFWIVEKLITKFLGLILNESLTCYRCKGWGSL